MKGLKDWLATPWTWLLELVVLGLCISLILSGMETSRKHEIYIRSILEWQEYAEYQEKVVEECEAQYNEVSNMLDRCRLALDQANEFLEGTATITIIEVEEEVNSSTSP